MIADAQLTPHFSLYEMTVTGNAELQEANRAEALKYLPSIQATAELLERIRDGRPLKVNSAFRSAALNKATAGSSPTSQHPMGQAADIHRPGQDPLETFREILEQLKREKIAFGQLIHESARRDYGTVSWVHISLGPDYWKPERCGFVMRKFDDAQGKTVYETLEKVPQEII